MNINNSVIFGFNGSIMVTADNGSNNNNRKLNLFKWHINIPFEPQEYTPRISLFIIAIIIKLAASAVSGIAYVFNNSMLYILGIMFWLLWFFFLFIIALPQIDNWLQKSSERLKKTARKIVIIVVIIGIVECIGLAVIGLDTIVSKQGEHFPEVLTSLNESFNYNDATALCHQAAENFLDGKNPYAEAHIVNAMQEYDVPLHKLTPLRLGIFNDTFPYPTDEQMQELHQRILENPDDIPEELESGLCYPAGSFLIPSLFLLLGISDLRIIYIILLVPALLYVIWLSPAKYRLLLLAIILISLELWNALASGETGFLLFPFLLLGWVLFKKHTLVSAISIGLAVTIKQVAWFFWPFYLILIYKTQGFKKAVQSLSIILLIFIATNLPFIISDPYLWYESIISPMTDKFPLGVGIITLVTGGLINIQSSLVFSILECLIFIGGIIWYYRNCYRYPHAGPLLAVLPLFFAWRSIWPYFFYFDIIIIASIIINEYAKQTCHPYDLALKGRNNPVKAL
ncbi:MAG: hypothetical protein WCZ22_00370 [Dehalococcoidales bacterium]